VRPDHVESQVLQRFEADATFTHVELLAALLVLAGYEPDVGTGVLLEKTQIATLVTIREPRIARARRPAEKPGVMLAGHVVDRLIEVEVVSYIPSMESRISCGLMAKLKRH
jgi:hypothetical protein